LASAVCHPPPCPVVGGLHNSPEPGATYGSPDKHQTAGHLRGYSTASVTRTLLRIPATSPRRARSPLCRITTYSPMRHWGVTKAKKSHRRPRRLGTWGEVSHAFGAHTVVFTPRRTKETRSPRAAKSSSLARRRDEEARGQLHFILDCVAPSTTSMLHQPAHAHGNITLVGAPRNRCLAASASSWTPAACLARRWRHPETQEMSFCGATTSRRRGSFRSKTHRASIIYVK